MHALVVAVSALELELGLLPPECVHQCMLWQWLPLLWSEAGPGTMLAPFPTSVLYHWQQWPPTLWNAVPEQEGLEPEPDAGWWVHWGSAGKPARAPGSFQSAVLILCLRVSKSTHVVFKSGVSISISW